MENLFLISSHRYSLRSDDVIVTSLETTLSRTACGKDATIFCLIYRKLKRIVVIFAQQHQRSKDKLTVYNESPPQLNIALPLYLLLYLAK